MASVTFYLNYSKRDKNDYVPIFLTFTNKSKRSRHYTGEKIPSPINDRDKFWNKEDQCVSRKWKEANHINDVLDDLKERYTKSFREEKVKGKMPTVSKTKSIVETSTGANTVNNDFVSLFNEYIKSGENIKSPGTIKNYKNSLKYLIDFSKDTRFNLEFDALDSSFNDKLMSYLVNGGCLTNNTIGRVYKNLKSFLNWASDKKFNANYDFKKFTVFKEDKEIIHLTEAELKKLDTKKFKNKFWNEIKDVFCFGCYTGQRIGDILNLKKEDIRDDIWFLRSGKTKDILQLDLLPQAVKILKKYAYELPKVSDVQINKNIKDICEDLGFDTPIVDIKYRGSERIETKHMKYELITTHVMRKTFVSLSRNKGIPADIIMAFTGHKDYRTMKPYMKLGNKTKKDSLFNAWK